MRMSYRVRVENNERFGAVFRLHTPPSVTSSGPKGAVCGFALGKARSIIAQCFKDGIQLVMHERARHRYLYGKRTKGGRFVWSERYFYIACYRAAYGAIFAGIGTYVFERGVRICHRMHALQLDFAASARVGHGQLPDSWSDYMPMIQVRREYHQHIHHIHSNKAGYRPRPNHSSLKLRKNESGGNEQHANIPQQSSTTSHAIRNHNNNTGDYCRDYHDRTSDFSQCHLISNFVIVHHGRHSSRNVRRSVA
mmetsp:Transcript_14651/g.21655  ORF Transcript_14651/g.21655 Transcript_14651/m.21655 type:complete len:251 (+) Transcript_14651:207-959(+)